MLRISGYGQTGPYRDKPGFGVVAEAMGGLRHLTAEPGRTPVRVGVSIGDTLAALHGVIGVLMALHERHAQRPRPGHRRGAVRGRLQLHGKPAARIQRLRRRAPARRQRLARHRAEQCLRCADGHVLVAGNGDSIFRRLMQAIGRPDLAADPQLAGNAGRVARVDEIDAAIGAWTASRTVAEVLAALDAAQVPGGRIYTVADIAADPHYRERGMLQEITLEDGSRLTGARHRAQALAHAGAAPAQCARAGPGHGRRARRTGDEAAAPLTARSSRCRALRLAGPGRRRSGATSLHAERSSCRSGLWHDQALEPG